MGEEAAPGDAWVFHAGALGDFVLIWPILRSLAHRYARVHVVVDSEKGRLVAEWIGAPGAIVAHDAQQRAFTRLWAGNADPACACPEATLVLNAVVDPKAASGMVWESGSRAMFPNARLVHLGPPGSSSRADAWREAGVRERGGVAARENPGGPVVFHVGAGSAAKRWALRSWGALRDRLGAPGVEVRVIAGEVEADEFSADERSMFESMGGEMCDSLSALARTAAAARVFVGCDSGPTHLAAQLGVPTLALFGPTDPVVWAPVGPRVCVLAPSGPARMEWLAPETVADALRELSG